MNKPVDVTGRTIQMGDKVAYCVGNSGTIMKIGTVTKMMPKTVEIDGSGEGSWRTLRAFKSVCIVATSDSVVVSVDTLSDALANAWWDGHHESRHTPNLHGSCVGFCNSAIRELKEGGK